MPLPSSGQLELSRIANTDGANSVGVVTPYSLGQLSILTGKEFVWDGAFFWNQPRISAFYNWAGYGYRFGSPAILHDYALSSRYSTSSSNIIDTSGNGRNGTFVSGTGNGTAVNIPSGYYDTGYVAKIRTNDISQYAIRLEDTAKFGGTAAFTWLTWFRVTSFQTNFPGLIACEGRSGSTPIGQTLHLVNSGGVRLHYVRWNGTTNSGSTNEIIFGANGVPAFQFNKWYMAAIRFNGSSAALELYVNGGRWSQVVSVSTSVTTSGSWGVFNGLRYNNWLDGHFGYTAIYSSDIGQNGVAEINYYTNPRYDI